MRLRALVVSLALLTGACDQLSTARFNNESGAPITLHIGALAPYGSPRGSGFKIAPGSSERVRADSVVGAPISLGMGGCDYVYRTIAETDEAFETGYGHQTVLDIRPDLGIYFKGIRTYPAFWKPAGGQMSGWPLRPLSKTCR